MVLPSISSNENFGMVQLEAMLYKKPVIATKLESGASTIVDHGNTGYLVEPKSVSELTQALKSLIEDELLAQRMGENGHELFLNKYTFEQMIKSHQLIYEKVLNQST